MAVLCAWLIARYAAPSAKLASICRAIARDARPPSFIARGAPTIRQAIRDLETIARRLQDQGEKLKAETLNLRTILAGMSEGIMVVDRNFQIQLTNRALEQMFRLTSAPAGRSVLEALRNPEIQKTVREAILHGEAIQREVTLLRDISSPAPPRSLALNTSPFLDESGNVQGAIVVVHDISKIRWMEESRKQFVANTSHELRTPLAIFKGYIETLIDDPGSTSPEARPILHTLQRHAGRLTDLVEDLLTLSNLESGALRLRMRPVDLAESISRTIADFQKTPMATGREFRVDLPGGMPPVQADPARLDQIFYNLIENALRYSKETAPITILARAIEGGDRVECAVIDEGIGIPAADLPRIFERFYRVEKARSRKLGGTGLGLSIVKHLVAAHGGTIEAESEVGRGTTIRFTLRRAPQDPGAPAE